MRFSSLSLRTGCLLASVCLGPGLVSFFWTPYDPTLMDMASRMEPPSRLHLLGTDHFGRDMASMIMTGARHSAAAAVIAVAIGASIGVPLGVAAAGRGGALDDFAMRINDLAFAFPALLTAVLLSASLGPGLFNAVLAIGIFNIPVFARISRAGALTLWRRDYVLAARLAGKGSFRIGFEHILPNLASVLIVQATIQFSLGLTAEAGLSYVGLGVQPPTPSWGRMLADSRTLIATAPHMAIIPGAFIMASVLSFNLIGEGLRDAFDSRSPRGAR